jgi:SWI/SNF-related matrix-associated actin-dependent regulator of chromatin subfamily A-like protein 1
MLKGKKRGKKLILKFPTNKGMLRIFKNIEGFQYNIFTETVKIPYDIQNVQMLKSMGFTLSKELEQQYYKDYDQRNPISSIHGITELGLKLLPFQMEGVNFLEKNNGNALIADEMGLGKTIQTLAWLKERKDIRPVLIICPSSVKINWKREINKWIPDASVTILSGLTPYSFHNTDFVIINYRLVNEWFYPLLETRFKQIILDEAHYIKSSKAKRTKTIKRLSKATERMICLTGTPIENRPIDIYNIVTVIEPLLFPNYQSFSLRYCDAKKTRFGWDRTGASNIKELHAILTRTVMIRRKKKDVLKELPPKQSERIILEISNRELYTKAERSLIEYLDQKFSDTEKDIEEKLKAEGIEGVKVSMEEIKTQKIRSAMRAPTLVKLGALRQLAAKGKLKQTIDWIQDFLDESDEKLVVFAEHTAIIEKVTEHFKDVAVRVDGKVTGNRRQQAIDQFKDNPKIRLFVGNIKAAGVGISLTAASNIIVLEYDWNPGPLAQAIDRVHRITQTKQVTVWYLIAENTIEEKILDLVLHKQRTTDKILDGRVSNETSILTEIIKSYRRK